jgi:C4-dicarboxylate-specific signal transduction histidine kinase
VAVLAEVAARLPRVEAFVLFVGTALALFCFIAAWRLLRRSRSAHLPASVHVPPFTIAPISLDGRTSGTEDVNQPLCAIIANADAIARLIEKQPQELAEVRAALADIVNDAQRASHALRRALLPLFPGSDAPDDIDVAQLVDQCMHQLRGEMVYHQVTCEVETAPQLPVVRGIRRQLLHLLTSLVANALEAMAGLQHRERRLRVRASRHDARAVAISIEDSGSGVHPENEARIFDPYFTTKASRHGLGLAVCRSIVHAHGGHISVGRSDGGGAAFKIVLPASS